MFVTFPLLRLTACHPYDLLSRSPRTEDCPKIIDVNFAAPQRKKVTAQAAVADCVQEIVIARSYTLQLEVQGFLQLLHL